MYREKGITTKPYEVVVRQTTPGRYGEEECWFGFYTHEEAEDFAKKAYDSSSPYMAVKIKIHCNFEREREPILKEEEEE